MTPFLVFQYIVAIGTALAIVIALLALDKAIEALRDECQHDWSYGGHGHNEDYYICVNCGASKWV
jgi:hypothetical protein